MTPLVERALILAEQELAAGVRESPPGSNRGERIDLYLRGVHNDAPEYVRFVRPEPGQSAAADGWRGARWCARFARWCFEQAAVDMGFSKPFVGLGDLASASKWRKRAKLHNRWLPAPEPGRVGVIIRRDGSGHVCLVQAVDDSVVAGGVLSIDGNFGDRVALVRRSAAEFTGFVEVGGVCEE